MRQYGVALAVLAVLAAALGASAASGLSSPKTFSLLDISSNDVQPINGFTFNRAPQGGDQFAIKDDLYKWAGTKKGARAGHVKGIGTFLTGFGSDFTQNATVLFTAQAFIQGGSILVEGYATQRADGPSTFVLPIIGGTGIYANARGTITVRNLGNGQGNNSNIDVRVLP
jgi:hypothetical protein